MQSVVGLPLLLELASVVKVADLLKQICWSSPWITCKVAQSTKEEEIEKEHKAGDDANLSVSLIIVEALAFVSQQLGDLEGDNTSNGHVW